MLLRLLVLLGLCLISHGLVSRLGLVRRQRLQGNFSRDGEYSLPLTIGGRTLNVLVDTGSADLGVSAVGCHGCTHRAEGRWYDPSRSPNATKLGCGWCAAHATNQTSSSCRGGQCSFRVSYEDETHFSAALWEDQVAVGEMPGVRAAVGAMYSASFANPKQIDGIIGLADQPESSSGAKSPLDELVKAGLVEDVFGLCLQEQGGLMYLTDNATELSQIAGPVRWTPRRRDGATPALYALTVERMAVGGKPIPVPSSVLNDGDAIVDSGTTDVALPSSAFLAVKRTFSQLCRSLCLKGVCDCQRRRPLTSQIFENRCVHMTVAERQAFPPVLLELAGGVRLEYPQEQYLRGGPQFCDRPGELTIGISRGGADGSGTILGDTFMRGKLVVHDRVRQRIGFAAVGDCP